MMRQDLRVEPQLFTTSNCLSYNANNISAGLFSQMNTLEQYRLASGQFQFKLCYPLLTDAANNGCIEFLQTSNPINITLESQTVAGLQILARPYPAEAWDSIFAGLRSDSPDDSCFDGVVGPNWWYPIGTKHFFYGDTIPAVDTSAGIQEVTLLAELYVQNCETAPCPIDGNWATWSSWTSCSVTCGAGTQSQTRTCSNPSPQFDGSNCAGSDSNFQTCATSPCSKCNC